MSRNIRRNYKTSAAKSRRRGSDTTATSIDLSDDEGYSAVEDISDSEDDDEEDVNAVEEENLIIEAIQLPSSPRPPFSFEQVADADVPVVYQDLDDDDDDDDDEEEEEEEEDNDDDDDDEDDEDADDHASWGGIVSEVEESQASDFYHDATAFSSDVAERHVRFDVPDSDSDSTDTDDDHADLFPDIFVSQTALDPAFRREIEDDPDDSSGSGSFWDYTNYNQNHDDDDDDDDDAEEIIRQLSEEDTPKASRMGQQVDIPEDILIPAFAAAQELDGYETDGDTTEEDTPEPPVRRRTRRLSLAKSEATDSEDDASIKLERGQPRIGRFNLDRSEKKPIAVLNPLTRKMMIFTPHRRRQLDLSPEQFNFSTWNLEETASPLLSNSANMMLSAMFSSNTFGDFVNAQTMGPAEAFFPFPSETGAVDGSSSPHSAEDDEDEVEKNLDISDFITWDDDGSSGDEEDPNNWPPSSTPVRPTTGSSEMEVLGHLNSETVGAFRRNQINQQLILSNQATQDSLAFSGPYNYTTIKGLKSDRFDTAGIPLTPIRRQRRQDARSPLETVSAKRKASTEASNRHKKQRSISDVNLLRI